MTYLIVRNKILLQLLIILSLYRFGIAQLGKIPQPIGYCKQIQQYDIDNINGRMVHQSCIVLPVPSPAVANANTTIDVISGKSVQILPGFQAGGFNSGGYFRAAIEKGNLGLAVFTPFDFSSGSVIQYEKLEIGIMFSNTISNLIENFTQDQSPAINPFNPEEIDVQAQFYLLNDLTGQWEEKQKVFGFYFDEYIRNTNDPNPQNWNWTKDTTSYQFRIRFATPDFGVWKCKITADIPGYGFFEAQEFEFYCVTSSSEYSGFLTVGNSNRYFKLSNDDFFFPLGQNLSSIQCDGCEDPNSRSLEAYSHNTIKPKGWITYQETMENFSELGGNYIRTFSSPWSNEIEFERLNNYSSRMSNAWEMDRILDKALSENLRIHLSLFTPYILQNDGPFSLFYWDWNENNVCTVPDVNDIGFCYKTELGLTEPREFFTDPAAIKYYKMRIRYLIARYGYSQNIGMFELMSEVNTAAAENEYSYDPQNCIYLSGVNLYETDPTFPPQVYEWQNEIARYIKQDLEHNNHLITVNYAGPPNPIAGDISFWSNYVDVINFNSYFLDVNNAKHYSENFNDYASINKPFLHSETGAISYAFGGEFDGCSNYTEWKKNVWATAFSGLAGAGMNWTGDFGANNVWQQFEHIKNIIGGADFDDGNWLPHWDERDTDHEAEVIYLQSLSKEKAIGIVFNKNWNWFTRGQNSSICSNPNNSPNNLPNTDGDFDNSEDVSWNLPASGILNRIHIANLGSFTNYRIDWFDALSGNFVQSQVNNTGIDGKIVLQYPILSMVEYEQPIFAFRLYKNGSSWLFDDENRAFEEINQEASSTNLKSIEASVEIFPNPANEIITIKIGADYNNSLITITDMTGKITLTESINSSTFSVDISHLAPALYVVKIKTPFGNCYKKLIIQ